MARLKPTHPRLLIKSSWADFKAKVEGDKQLSAWRLELKREADKCLPLPISKHVIPDGLRLLWTSRAVLTRTQILALAYRLEGTPAYKTRLWQELNAAANFPDWNPRHFLDTAEMTHAFAIGYDWLYDVWTPEQRTQLRTAIVEKGLTPGLKAYTNKSYWTKYRNNWNQVCNGGLGAGALAIGDEEPEISGKILTNALRLLPLAMNEFAPDGAWSEGAGYWSYATSYNVMILAALDSALGTDFGLSDLPGFNVTGLFPVYMTSPIGKAFNYADGGDGPVHGPQLFWFSTRFNQPLAARQELRYSTFKPYLLVYYQPFDTKVANSSPDKYFRGPEVVTLRSSWDDKNALYLGFKVGDNRASHGHLDLGTFVLDALGERWIFNNEKDTYQLPGYFDSKVQRWTYYRLRAEGHNTLVLNPSSQPDQDLKATAKIDRFDSQKEGALAITDLSAAYPNIAKVQRGVQLLGRTSHPQVIVQDEIEAGAPADLWWFAHTQADVKLNDAATLATLTINGKQLQARLMSPPGAKFQVMDAVPLPSSPQPAKQNPNTGMRKLAIHLPGTSKTRIAVAFVPVMAGAPDVPLSVKPLSEWSVFSQKTP